MLVATRRGMCRKQVVVAVAVEMDQVHFARPLLVALCVVILACARQCGWTPRVQPQHSFASCFSWAASPFSTTIANRKFPSMD